MPDWLNGVPRPAFFTLLIGLAAALLLLAALGFGFLDEPGDGAGWPPAGAASAAPSVTAQETPRSTADGPPPALPSPALPSPSLSPLDPSPTASLTVRPTEPASPPSGEDVPLVPVVGFWAHDVEISLADLHAAVAGRSLRWQRVIVPAPDRAAIESALGVTLGSHVESGELSAVRRGVRRGALGLMRATDVSPGVRALALEGKSLFGNERLQDDSDWPLRMSAGDGEDWRQQASWTLVAGGDIQLDRWMAHHVTTLEKGVDWPWDGGTVRITGRLCCSALGHRIPIWQSTGNEGAVRSLISGADLAMANLEAAAVDDPSFHRLSPRFRLSLDFSGDPRLLDGLRDAGFDFLSLANNHIHNAGEQGIIDTRRNLRDRDIAFAGAGRHLQQASRPAKLEAGGQRIVVLPCITVGRLAGSDRAGSAPCRGDRLPGQIREAAESADVVIVFPHWGREYRSEPSASQRELARRWVDAGADLVLGAHSHWAGAIEEIGDGLVLYSMGNLAFDQPWSETTMQGVIVELTFNGERLVQVRLHPTLIVDDVQPNLLELDGGGERVLRRMRDASDGLLSY